MKTIREFAEGIDNFQEEELVYAIWFYFPSIRVIVSSENPGVNRQPWQWEVIWRGADITTEDRSEFIVWLIVILSEAVLSQKRGMPKLVRFFHIHLGWPIKTSAELREYFLAEAIAV